jgi:hypothetical protein
MTDKKLFIVVVDGKVQEISNAYNKQYVEDAYVKDSDFKTVNIEEWQGGNDVNGVKSGEYGFVDIVYLKGWSEQVDTEYTKVKLLVLQATKQAGSYYPMAALTYIEEQLTYDQYNLVRDFLNFVVSNSLTIGTGNYDQVWGQFRLFGKHSGLDQS